MTNRLVDADGFASGADCRSLFIPCRWHVTGGRTTRVEGRRSARVSGLPGGVAVAAGAGLVAVAPAGGTTTVEGMATGPCACNYTPDWSPRGDRLAFASGRESDGTSI